MKKTILIITLCLLCGVICWTYEKSSKDYDASIAIVCIGQEVVVNDNQVSFKFSMADGKVEKCLKLNSEELVDLLSSKKPEDVIGLHIFLHIPAKVVRETHLDVQSLDAVWLLYNTNMFDNYFEIVGASFATE